MAFADGKEIYRFYCYQCHAYSGNARTLSSTYLDPPPRDFTAETHSSLPEERMLDAVSNGRAGTAMVFGYLGGGTLPFEEPFPGSAYIFAFRGLLPDWVMRLPEGMVLPFADWINAGFAFLRDDLGLMAFTRAPSLGKLEARAAPSRK